MYATPGRQVASPARRFFYRSFYRVPNVGNPEGEAIVKGYVAKKGDRWYAVIYEGLDPITGKERRR